MLSASRAWGGGHAIFVQTDISIRALRMESDRNYAVRRKFLRVLSLLTFVRSDIRGDQLPEQGGVGFALE